jgi:hypothetical protein
MAERLHSGGIPIPRPEELRFRWFCPKPTVEILFYTDDFSVSLDPGIDANDFGVRILRDLLIGDDSDIADFQVTLLNRHDGGHANNRLTASVLAPYDQVWFFGIAQANTTSQPQNELTDAEVAALADWMSAGGVLITGDHSNPRPSTADPALDDLLNLGRAIGYRVPRAGLLRRWEGGPGQFDDNYNTQVPTPETPISEIQSLDAQEDEWPQQLILKTYPLATGGPLDASVYGRRVHRLFCGRTAPISVFPDHMHEGHVELPSTFPTGTWPSGPSGQPRPEVIARGTDKRTGEIYDIVVAYDGEEAEVGRIVADSTWHHYFNVNLKGFPAGGAVLDQLARFYVNLAVWLSPPAKRAQIACWLRWKLLHIPTVQMTYRNSRANLGLVAAGVLRRLAGPCVIRDVFYPTLTAARRHDGLRPSDELMLGGVLDAYFKAFEQAEAGEDLGPEADSDALVANGIRAAHDDLVADLEHGLEQARGARAELEEHLQPDG